MVKANVKREVWRNISLIMAQASKSMPADYPLIQFLVILGGRDFGRPVDDAMEEEQLS